MRNLTKATEPKILVDNTEEWTKELLAAVPRSKEFYAIEARYGNDEIRQALSEETCHKCAYCESTMESVSYPHVEHIRPKSLNRELTFRWDNLTVACQVCNTKKGSVEPSPTNFVNPYTDDPESRMRFMGPIVTPRDGSIAVVNMINWLDLNRAALIISRAEIVNRVVAIYLEAITLGGATGREFLRLSLLSFLSEEARHMRAAADASADLGAQYSDALADDGAA